MEHLAHMDEVDGGYHMWDGGISGLYMVFWMIFGVALISLTVLGLVKLFGDKYGVKNNQEKSPLDVAKDRYAKGDINKKEFEEIKTNLNDKN